MISGDSTSPSKTKFFSTTMKHYTEDQIAEYVNKYITSRDVKIKRMIIPKQLNKNDEAMVYIMLRRYDARERKDIKRKKIATNIRVKPKNWSTKKGEVMKSDLNHTQKNRFIKDKESQITNYVYNPSVDYIMAQLSREEFLLIEEVFPSKRLLKYKKSLTDYIEEYYERRKKLGHSRGTVKEFKTVLNRIKRFDDESNNKKTYLPDINISWSDNFEVWLKEQGYSDGTIEKTYTILKTVLNYYWEIREERNIDMNDRYTSSLFKRGTPSKNKPNPLTEEQLMALYNHSFEERHLEHVRKMVLLQCFIGMRYDDIKRIRPENIHDDFLKFTPIKTKRYDIEVEQPLHPYSKSLLKEVNYDTSCYKMSNQPYNKAIKEVFKRMAAADDYKHLKFKIDYTSHNFRDTFISLAVCKGVNWKSILKWVGQSSYKVMDRYVHLTKPFEESEMKKIFG